MSRSNFFCPNLWKTALLDAYLSFRFFPGIDRSGPRTAAPWFWYGFIFCLASAWFSLDKRKPRQSQPNPQESPCIVLLECDMWGWGIWEIMPAKGNYFLLWLQLPICPICYVAMKFKLGEVYKRRGMRNQRVPVTGPDRSTPGNNRKVRFASKSVQFCKIMWKKLLLDIILAVWVCFYGLWVGASALTANCIAQYSIV